MNNKLLAIAQFIDKQDKVLDMACDHAYLAIYLKKNHLCTNVYASDISESALNNARNNIKKAQVVIKTYLSDGFENITDADINTVIISGVGTKTIESILTTIPPNITKFIISSNNNLPQLRTLMQEKGFYNIEETTIYEHDKYYSIIKFIKTNKKDSPFILKYGKTTNLDYYNYLITKNKSLLKTIPITKIKTRFKLKKELKDIKKILKERK